MSHFEIFPWNNNFETGISLIDEQHRELVRLLNSLVSHIAREAEAPVLDKVIQEISDYVLYHFAAEEEIWQFHFEGDSWLKWHHQSHGDFVKEIAKIREAERIQSFDETLLDIVKFLTHWLARHILDSDKRMAKVVLALPSGISLAMAKEAADAEMTGAAKVLVETLMTMYDRLADSTVEMSREIQRRQKAEIELVRAKSVLEQDSRAKSAFLANLSHELRTPLNTILGYSELLYRDASVSGSVKDTLSVIRKSGDHLLTVINEVLEIAKIEAGHVQLELAPVDLSVTIEEVLDMFQLRAGEKNIALRFDRASGQRRYVVTDEAKVKQILINLLSNAIKATQHGGVQVRLKYTTGNGGHAQIEVEDSGVGIAPDDWEKIFAPFVQIEAPESRQGSGLGLAISREFVGLLGGHITLSSEVGKGSTFRFDFPVTEPQIQDISYIANEQGDVIGLAEGQAPVRILVVDDENDNRILLARLIESAGLSVEVAGNGMEAMERFQTWTPDFIWMDCRMPVMGGVEAARRIRALPGGRQVKIAAVTASIAQEDALETGPSDFDSIVYKPFRAQQIFECMERLMGLRYRREKAGKTPDPAFVLDLESLRSIPGALLKQLLTAFRRLSQEAILEVITRIGERDGGLANELQSRVQRYDYESIIKLLEMIDPLDESGTAKPALTGEPVP